MKLKLLIAVAGLMSLAGRELRAADLPTTQGSPRETHLAVKVTTAPAADGGQTGECLVEDQRIPLGFELRRLQALLKERRTAVEGRSPAEGDDAGAKREFWVDLTAPAGAQYRRMQDVLVVSAQAGVGRMRLVAADMHVDHRIPERRRAPDLATGNNPEPIEDHSLEVELGYTPSGELAIKIGEDAANDFDRLLRSLEHCRAKLNATGVQTNDILVVLHPEPTLRWEDVVHACDAAQRAGFANVAYRMNP